MQNHKVLILGPRGSGKTVFLCSMYYQLSMATSTNFYVETTNAFKGKLLKNNFIGLLTKWPDANVFAEMDEWEFKCFVKTPKKNFPTFSVTYYDYSGGRITEAIDDEGEFQEIVENADIILGLIDGDKLFNDADQNDIKLMFELDMVITELNNRHIAGKPVHLVISKWDMLHNRNITISQVREKLLKYPMFAQFAENIKANGDFIRLIPVSSVGFNFAEKVNEDMRIKPNATLNPYNVDVPLALALLDPMQTKLNELIKEFEKLQKTEEVRVYANLPWWQRLQRWAGGKIEQIAKQFQIDSVELDHLVNFWKKSGEDKIRYAKEKEVEMREKLKSKIHSVDDEKSAIDYILYSFHTIETNLELTHPGSIIQ